MALDAEMKDYTVTITASDGVNPPVTSTYTMRVEARPTSGIPVILTPDDQTYYQGQTIPELAVNVQDVGDNGRISIVGLPPGLAQNLDAFLGTVAADAEVKDYTVTITVIDGAFNYVTDTFTITVLPPPPTVTRKPFEGESAPGLDVSWTRPNANGATISGYKIRYRVPGQSWQSIPNAWANHTTATIPDLQPGVTYEVRMAATTSDTGDLPWSFIATAMTNRPPLKTPNWDHGNETFPQGSRVAVAPGGTWNINFSDPDNDELVPFVESSDPARVSLLNFYGLDRPYLFQYENLNQGQATLTYGVTDGYGGKAPEVSFTVTVTHEETREILERSPSRTPVGEPVTGVPYQGEALTYSLTGDAAAPHGPFIIDSDSGQVRLAPGVTLLYEGDWCRSGRSGPADIIICEPLPANKSFTGQVSYTVGGHSSAIDVTIEVTPIQRPSAPSVVRKRFEGESAAALFVMWFGRSLYDPVITGYEAQYRKQGVAEWTAYGSALAPEAISFTIPDMEPGAMYEVQVRVKFANDPGPWSETGEGRANRPPLLGSQEFSNLSGHPVGTIIRPRGNWYEHFNDPDGDTFTPQAVADKQGRLRIQDVTISPTPDLEMFSVHYLNQGHAEVTYGVLDGYGGKATKSFTVDITHSATLSIAEGSPARTPAGAPVTGIPYEGETLTYALAGEAASTFQINQDTGQITLREGQPWTGKPRTPIPAR